MPGYAFPNPVLPNKQFENIDLGHTEDNYLQLIKKLKALLPIECSDKIKALEEVISYVSAILYCDDLHQFATFNYYKKYAIDALSELIAYVQEHSIDNYGLELALLKEEIEKAIYEKEQYLIEISELTDEREKLQSEVKILKDEKDALSLENCELKKSLDNYRNMMQACNGDCQVVWENVTDDNPIYAVIPTDIADYIYKLKQAYRYKLGISEEECESDFILNSAGLLELQKLLLSFEKYNDKPISYLIENTSYLGIDIGRACSLKKLMPNIKLPRIIKKQNALLDVNLTSSDGNLDGLLRELYFQRMALDALAKQRIAEVQLSSLIAALKQTLPNNYDFNQITQILDSYSTKLLSKDEYDSGRSR